MKFFLTQFNPNGAYQNMSIVMFEVLYGTASSGCILGVLL
jgi:hypothetical protein